MAIRCTITASGVTNEYGQALAIGTVYTPYNDDYALALISQGKATDTDDFLEERINAPFDEVVYPIFPDDFSPVGLSVDGTSLVSGDGTALTIYQDAPSTGYFCHLYAPNQDVCDPYVADISGALNHATLGANLSKAEVWGTTAGMASTLTANADEVLHLPACNFDFAGGESMLLMWKGKITAPGSALPFIGNSAGSSAKGICPMRILTDGTCQGYISSGTASFFDITSAIADGTVHTFGLVLDGVASKYAMWVDGVNTRTLIALTSRDTVNTNQFMVGNTQASIWGAATSVASGTKALVVLRGRTGLGLPANYDALMKALMANPGKLVSRTEW